MDCEIRNTKFFLFQIIQFKILNLFSILIIQSKIFFFLYLNDEGEKLLQR